MKKINIGRIQIATWKPSTKRMFSFEFYYDPSDEFHDNKCDKEVKKCDPNEVVLPPGNEYTLILDYPVSFPYKVTIKSGKKGITRIKLADIICKHYHKMYAEEDYTAGGNPGNIPGMLNRETSDGKYGIWGHNIDDLLLVDATVHKNGNIKLGVDS